MRTPGVARWCRSTHGWEYRGAQLPAMTPDLQRVLGTCRTASVTASWPS
ncbi:hypothetical protein I553_4349 [Mycobacterium xenopi 4042]|uniref:Uncharacterized protein n=1 Tax=Mycobacterium xenopi 4042 TaxID=1299334 RepID=X8AGE9_MYCXE|nr:hypothetical protein I553_4349 [Mycobacterium xenopi 4042]EUA50786.1 hypothetical protein I552_1726 [Mycobacterium xenopi 3993]